MVCGAARVVPFATLALANSIGNPRWRCIRLVSALTTPRKRSGTGWDAEGGSKQSRLSHDGLVTQVLGKIAWSSRQTVRPLELVVQGAELRIGTAKREPLGARTALPTD